MDQTHSLQNLASQIPQIYCVKCRSKTGNLQDIKVEKTKNNRFILMASCAVCGKRKRMFVSAKEGQGILDILKKFFAMLTSPRQEPKYYDSSKAYNQVHLRGMPLNNPVAYDWRIL